MRKQWVRKAFHDKLVLVVSEMENNLGGSEIPLAVEIELSLGKVRRRLSFKSSF